MGLHLRHRGRAVKEIVTADAASARRRAAGALGRCDDRLVGAGAARVGRRRRRLRARRVVGVGARRLGRRSATRRLAAGSARARRGACGGARAARGTASAARLGRVGRRGVGLGSCVLGAPRRSSPASSACDGTSAVLSRLPARTAFDGPSIIVMLRPSWVGRCSTTASSASSSARRSSSICAALGVRHLAPAEHDRDLDLVLALAGSADVALLGVVVVLRDLRAELDLADRDLLLVLARRLLLLGLLVLVLRVVEHAADGRARLGRDLDEVEIALLRVAQRLVGLA